MRFRPLRPALVLVPLSRVEPGAGQRPGRHLADQRARRQALDLLLVTDLTPKEFVFGKLGGVFYNTKEMVLLPMLLCGYLWTQRAMSGENLLYLLGGLAVLYVFVAMLGVHAGMSYANSRTAIGGQPGHGLLPVRRRGHLHADDGRLQRLVPLAVPAVFGVHARRRRGALRRRWARNPSPAIGVASFLCPFATFYAITSFLLNYTLGVFLVTVAAYGFTTAAMLIPAIYEFDVATGPHDWRRRLAAGNRPQRPAQQKRPVHDPALGSLMLRFVDRCLSTDYLW